jgi:hypothetical protein
VRAVSGFHLTAPESVLTSDVREVFAKKTAGARFFILEVLCGMFTVVSIVGGAVNFPGKKSDVRR